MVELRDLKEQDSEMLRNWRNMPEVAAYMYTDHLISAEEHARWFAGIKNDPTRRYWVIVYKGEDVGLVNLAEIDQKNKRSNWAYYLASPSVRGKGVGSYVEWAILNHVFEDLKLHKLVGEVLGTNPKVVELHRSFGFTVEGQLREHVIKNGQFVDVVVVGILAKDWAEKKPQVAARIERLMKRWTE